MIKLKYYQQNLNLKDFTEKEKFLYFLENERFTFIHQLDEYIEKNQIDLPDEFIFINISSSALEWIIFFQNEFDCIVQVEEFEFEGVSFKYTNEYSHVIGMIIKKKGK